MRIDADDFISPGLECTKPPEKTETGQVVSISIDDCLACSGCITSAEEIMLQQHNTDEIVQFLEKRNSEMTDDRNSVVICGISGQSLASLCVEAGTSVAEYMAEVRRLLAANGVDYIAEGRPKICDKAKIFGSRGQQSRVRKNFQKIVRDSDPTAQASNSSLHAWS